MKLGFGAFKMTSNARSVIFCSSLRRQKDMGVTHDEYLNVNILIKFFIIMKMNVIFTSKSKN